MFGYIAIDKPEMKWKEFETFRAYYCGLCREIGKNYGQPARFALSYDCAFLYVLAAAVAEGPPAYQKKRCVSSPFKKKPYAIDEGAAYAAAVNVLLAVSSLRDHVRDDGALPARGMLLVYRAAYKKAAADFPGAARIIEDSLEELDALERQRCGHIDRVADAFAAMLGEIFRGIGGQERVLSHMGYNMGRWIYLADAYADLEEDAKEGRYNPFLCKYGLEAAAEKHKTVLEDAKYALLASLDQAAAAWDLLETKKHRGILDNILHLGLYKKTEQILNGGKGKTGNGSV